MSDPNLSSFIWSVADLLRGDYKQSDYAKVILPFTVLRRLESEHGSVEAYLDSIGVDAARRKRLAEALLTTEVCEVA